MTEAEAQAIARIVSTADHGCSLCIRDLIYKLNAADLGYQFALIDKEYWSEPDPFYEDNSKQWPLVRAELGRAA